MSKKSIEYLNTEIHGRFDRRNTVFYRRNIFTGFDHFTPEILNPDDPELLELAEARASWTLHDNYPGAFRDTLLADRELVHNHDPFSFEFNSPKAAAENMAGVAKRFGASLVGTTKLDSRWLYSHKRSGSPVTLPEKAVWAVVMLVEMDRECISRSPDFSAAANPAGLIRKWLILPGPWVNTYVFWVTTPVPAVTIPRSVFPLPWTLVLE